MEDIILNKESVFKDFFDSYIENGQYEPNTTSKVHFVEWFEGDYILAIVSNTTGVAESEFLDYAPIYFDNHLNKEKAS